MEPGSARATEVGPTVGAPLDPIARVAACVHALQDALHRTLVDLEVAGQPRIMARRLDINRGLAWRISRALAERSAGDALRVLPRAKSLGLLLDACAEEGAKPESVEHARTAVVELEAAIVASGEDRRSLPVLLVASGTVHEEDGTPHFDSARQQLFEGARVIWGVEVEVGFRLVVIWPTARGADGARSPDAGPPALHGAIIRGTVGLSTLRPDRWPIAYAQSVSGENQVVRHGERPLDPDSDLEVPLMRRFCEPRSLAIHPSESRGMRRFEVKPGAVGRAGRLTCVLGTALDAPYEERPSSAPGDVPGLNDGGTAPSGALMMIIETPIRRLIVDLLVHRDLELTRPGEVTFCDRLTRTHGYHLAHVAGERLPLDGTPVELGRGAQAMATSQVPWYPELVSHVATRLGFSADDFTGHRFECSHPPIASAALLHFWARRRADA